MGAYVAVPIAGIGKILFSSVQDRMPVVPIRVFCFLNYFMTRIEIVIEKIQTRSHKGFGYLRDEGRQIRAVHFRGMKVGRRVAFLKQVAQLLKIPGA